MNLADEYMKFEKTMSKDTTLDDFFDHCSIPKEERTDFLFASIMKQVIERENKIKLETTSYGRKICF